MTDHVSSFQQPTDPKNVQELTNFVQLTLQQMQDKFQSMIDDLEKNIADLINQSGEEHHK
ncbi:heat shock factor-binding 1 [Brachionus plicatilis]|uniref:Heat shock factor-binding 1 n=1 Tax=Brachionus plicatilis TaxID=10195 RepID=A0A3M7Q4R4_BRAPC|nr:heat shock factor-binding 1 [Brachionus plicatilis]